MSLLNIFCIVVALFCGFGCCLAWEEGFDAGRRRARRDRVGIDRKQFIAALTRYLDIQADGGDRPEAFVEWAVKKALKEHDNG